MKAEKTRENQRRILAAAVEVIIERGYARATLREVARRAEVTDDTLFRLFANKAAVVTAYYQQRLEDALGLVTADEAFGNDPLADRLAAWMQTHLTLLRPDRELLEETGMSSELQPRLLIDSQIQDSTVRAVEEVINRGLDDNYTEAPFHKLAPSWLAIAYQQLVLAYWMNDLSEHYHKTFHLISFLTRLFANLWENRPAFEGLEVEDFPRSPFPTPTWWHLFDLRYPPPGFMHNDKEHDLGTH